MYFKDKMNNEFTNCTREKKLIENSRKELDDYTYEEITRYDCGCFIYDYHDATPGYRDYSYSVNCKNCKFKEGKNNG